MNKAPPPACPARPRFRRRVTPGVMPTTMLPRFFFFFQVMERTAAATTPFIMIHTRYTAGSTHARHMTQSTSGMYTTYASNLSTYTGRRVQYLQPNSIQPTSAEKPRQGRALPYRWRRLMRDTPFYFLFFLYGDIMSAPIRLSQDGRATTAE